MSGASVGLAGGPAARSSKLGVRSRVPKKPTGWAAFPIGGPTGGLVGWDYLTSDLRGHDAFHKPIGWAAFPSGVPLRV
jgi:hypothetical protein